MIGIRFLPSAKCPNELHTLGSFEVGKHSSAELLCCDPNVYRKVALVSRIWQTFQDRFWIERLRFKKW